MMKKTVSVVLIILFFTLLFSSCVLQDLFGGSSRTTKVRVTITPETPSYIGQTLKVHVTTTPKKELAYIRLTTKNFVTGEERAYTYEDVSAYEFSVKINSSQFGFFVETPGKTRSNGKEIWWPSKDAYIEIEDYTPPTVSVNVSRISETSNDFTLAVIADESESAISRRWVTVNGTEYTLDGQRDSTVLTLPIGTHVIRGYAQNRYGYTGSSSNKYMEVTPPRSNTPANISWNHPKQLTPFADEIVPLSAQITDNISYVKRIELQTQSGNKKTYNFDPMVQTYSLRYNLKATKSEKVTVTVTNGNNILSTDSVDLSIINHRAPKVTLTGPTGPFPIDESKTYTLTIEAYDDALIENAWFLVNNATVNAFQGIGESVYTKTLTYSVLKGKKYLKAIAKDDRGATGQSDEIEVIGFKEDKTPPRIQLYVPNVAYTNVQTDLSFLVQDSDSDLAGIPSISVLEEDLTLNPLTYDNAFYFSKWTPEATGTRTVQVKAADTAGNQATATASIMVKDPTGIVRPTVGALAAYPNSLMLGSTVSLVLSVTPPVQNSGGISPVVEIAVTAPNAETPFKLSPVTGNGNIYTGTYRPVTPGIHTAIAFIQWGEDQYTRSCTFRVDSPDPTMVFTVEPQDTYIGNIVTLKLSPDTSNPNASVTILEMSVEDEALSWVKTFGSGGSVIYVATKSTLEMNAGTKTARAKIRDSFGNELESVATFMLRAPQLRITGYKYTTDSGELLNAYDPTRFEVYMGNHVPASIPINGEIAITRTSASSERASIETYPLQRTLSNVYTFVTSEKWIPKESGTYGLTLRLSGVIGNQATETTLATQVSVAAAQLNIGLSATPVDIDKIRTGESFTLVFSVTGATEVDPIKTLSYGIRSGTAVHQTETALTSSGNHVYTHTPPAFGVAGTYTITATAVTFSGNTKVLARVVEVKVPSITISIESSPVPIDRITVGNPVDLRFSVDGIPSTDRISSFAYALWKGNTIYKDVVYLNQSRAAIYIDTLAPFVSEGEYTIVATVTTAGLSIGSNSRTFNVLSAEIRKKTFTLDGNPNQLFIGAPLYFILELENPNAISELSVRMYVTDENGTPIPGVGPISAQSSNNTTFRNVDPFYISEAGTITVYASVTLIQVPQIDLPGMRSDSDYVIPPSTVGIYLDESKQYLAGYEGSLRVTVTIPQGMNIQSPRVVLTNTALGEIDPTPYASELNSNTVKYFSFKFTPTLPGNPVVDISVFDASDFSLLNPLTTKRATLSVIEFRPQVRIVGTTDGENRFIQVKDPEIRMELTQVPEFFNGAYRFEARLNGTSAKDSPIISTTSNATASFEAAQLNALLGPGVAVVNVDVYAYGSETFEATGEKSFDVVLPSISNLHFPSGVLDADYRIYENSELQVGFNNNDRLSANPGLIQVRVEIQGNPTPYTSYPIFSGTTIPVTAIFDNVIFTTTGDENKVWATPSIYCLNTVPPSLLATSTGVQLKVFTSVQRVDIYAPSKDARLFVGQRIEPIIRLSNIPPVITGVALAIWRDGDSEPWLIRNLVRQGETSDWALHDNDSIVFEEPSRFTMVATATSSQAGEIPSDPVIFEVKQGDLKIRSLGRSDLAGSLLFIGEEIGYLLEYTFDNPILTPESFATLTHTASQTRYTIRRVSRTQTPGDPVVFAERWTIGASESLASGPYQLELAAISGPSSDVRQANFTVLQGIIINENSAKIDRNTVSTGEKIYGSVEITLPGDFLSVVPESDVQTYLNGSIRFENCSSAGTFHRLFTDPGGNKLWFIEATGTANPHSGDPGTEKSFKVFFTVSLDSKQVLNVQKEYGIKNPEP